MNQWSVYELSLSLSLSLWESQQDLPCTLSPYPPNQEPTIMVPKRTLGISNTVSCVPRTAIGMH